MDPLPLVCESKVSVVYDPSKALARTKFVQMGLIISPHEQNQLIKHTILVWNFHNHLRNLKQYILLFQNAN